MTAAKQEQVTATETEKPVARAGVVMSILLLIFFLSTSDNQMLSPLLPLIARELGVAPGEVGAMMVPAYALAAAAAALVIGPMSDKYGRRRFLMYASILFAASLLLVPFIKDPRVLAGVRLFTGLAAGTFSMCSIAYVADYFPYERRGVAMSVVQAGYFGALVIGVPAANQLAQWRGWRMSFALFGVLSLVAFVLVAAFLPEDKHAMAELQLSQRMSRRFDNIRMIFETRDRLASIAAAFFVSGGFVGFMSFLGSWLTNTLGLGTTQVNVFFVLVGFASLIGGLAAGPIADKFGKRMLSILSTIVLAAMLPLIPRLGWGAVLFASFLIASLSFAFRQGPLQALATELIPRQARGALVAVRTIASQIGIALATTASGLLFDRFGYGAVGWFSGVMTLAAAVCIGMMKEPAAATSKSKTAR